MSKIFLDSEFQKKVIYLDKGVENLVLNQFFGLRRNVLFFVFGLIVVLEVAF